MIAADVGRRAVAVMPLGVSRHHFPAPIEYRGRSEFGTAAAVVEAADDLGLRIVIRRFAIFVHVEAREAAYSLDVALVGGRGECVEVERGESLGIVLPI